MKKHQALQIHWIPFAQCVGARKIVNARRNRPDMELEVSTNSKGMKFTGKWPQSIRAAKATRIYKLYRDYSHLMLQFTRLPCKDPRLLTINQRFCIQNETLMLFLATSLIWKRDGQCHHKSRKDPTSMSQYWPKINRILGRSMRAALL